MEREKQKSGQIFGEMPTPYFLKMRNHREKIRWIGIKAPSFDGNVKTFLWWTNCQVSDFNRGAALIAQLKTKAGVEATFGLPIDLYGVNSSDDFVKTIDDAPGIFGLYVVSGQRQVVDQLVTKKNNQVSLDLFVSFFDKAKAILPQPSAQNRQR